MNSPCPSPIALVAALAACALFAACVVSPVTDARKQFEAGQYEEALATLQKLYRDDPSNLSARTEYFRLRDMVVTQWLAQAETLRLAGDYTSAEGFYRRIERHDPDNSRARAGLVQIESDKRHRTLVASAERLMKEGKFVEAQNTLRPVLAENPQNRDAQRLQRRIEERLMKPAITVAQLKTTSNKPISLELRDVTLRSAFDVLGRASGINFVFDRDLRPDLRTTVLVRDASIEETLRIMLLTNQLDQKVLNERTVFVFPNTPAKQREHRELVVRGFYLANADVKQTANMVRTLVKTRDIFIDEKLNLIIVKDTPEAVRLVERLIAAQDLAEAEVILEVEVLEVATSRLLELGVRWPDQVQFQDPNTVPSAGGAAALLQRATGPLTGFVATPVILLRLHQQDGSTSVLANPRIRVKNKEKARVHIGDRVPVITTTAAATGGFVSESVSYLDVGLKLEVEPLVSLDDDVGIKVGLEVSNIVSQVRGSNNNTLAYQIGTRNAATTLRLRDGETQVLAGLISDEDRRTADRVPGIGQLPIIGRLFSSNSDTLKKTEIVLLITPRLVRTLARPEAGFTEFAAGTDATSGAAQIGPPVLPFTPPPVPAQPTPPPTTPFQPAPPETPGTPGPAGAAPVPMVPFGGVQGPSTQPTPAK